MFGNMSNLEVIKALAPVIVVYYIFVIFCLYRITKDRVKYLPKWVWALIVAFVNPFGIIAYFILGRERD